MHFLMTPVGSSGDVHPVVGIGARLRARGHDVTVITGEPFRPLVERHGLAFAPVWTAEEQARAIADPDLWHARKGLRITLDWAAVLMDRTYAVLDQLYDPGRSVLVGHTLAFGTRVFEEKHGPRVRAATLHLAPSVFRSDYQQAAFGPNATDLTRLPRLAKRAIWAMLDRFAVDPMIRRRLNRWRRTLGLRPIRRVFNHWLHSPCAIIGLFPDWFGQPQRDWPPVRLTGFPLFDEGDGRSLDADLDAFLAAGDAPVAFTPGTANRHARAFFDAALDAVGRLGCRGLFLTEFPEHVPSPLPPEVRHASYAPFSRLLPRAAAIVHHGGIGTCAQGLAAGIPQVVVPHGFDQPDNGARLARLGVGALIPARRFTGDRLATVVRALLENERSRAACARYREWMASTDAAELACKTLEEVSQY